MGRQWLPPSQRRRLCPDRAAHPGLQAFIDFAAARGGCQPLSTHSDRNARRGSLTRAVPAMTNAPARIYFGPASAAHCRVVALTRLPSPGAAIFMPAPC
jgi:hypothetical protein